MPMLESTIGHIYKNISVHVSSDAPTWRRQPLSCAADGADPRAAWTDVRVSLEALTSGPSACEFDAQLVDFDVILRLFTFAHFTGMDLIHGVLSIFSKTIRAG